MDQYFPERLAQNDLNKEDESPMKNWKSISTAVSGSDNNPSGGFDCNICLDFVQDPVVTLCGHLFCWPCIYKWLHFQTEDPDQKHPQCPVCKSQVSDATLVPLYGRGRTTKPSNAKTPHLGIVIPRRPTGPACGFDAPPTATAAATTSPRPSHQLHYRDYRHHSEPYYPHPYSNSYAASPTLSPGAMATTSTHHPIIGMFGEMVYARVFGNSVTNLYTYPNSYHLAGNTSPRMRRHVMQADKSLSRICFFLFCCILLCLLLF